MTFSRRAFLRVGLLTAGTAASCRSIRPNLGERGAAAIPENFPEEVNSILNLVNDDPVMIRLFNRAGYGPRPADLAAVDQLEVDDYLEDQLDPDHIDDGEVKELLAQNDLYRADIETLLEEEPPALLLTLAWETIARRIYSQRQLYEVMVEFWSDHFHIYPRKARPLFAFKILDDRTVIRPHAFGRFRDLLAASVYSPAMLIYLDNIRNLAANPNENYARELLELHTLGIDGGYTQQDVEEVARALTGLTIARRGSQRGEVVFVNRRHDNGPKSILGEAFKADAGEDDIEQLINLLAAHPQTAAFIAYKLVRRFVADTPPQGLVESTSAVFLDTDGDIRAVLRHILKSEEFLTAPPKLKRPLTFFVSACRALNAQIEPSPALGELLNQLGQVPFMWPAPNGYPDVAPAWTGTLLARWNFAFLLAHNRIPGISFEYEGETLSDDLLTRLSDARYDGQPIFNGYTEKVRVPEHFKAIERDLLALRLSSPGFQWM